MIQTGDHVSLILPDADNNNAEKNLVHKRKFRRYWNQLPRCQKNIIIIVFISACVSILLFISSAGDDNSKVVDSKILHNIQILPYKDDHDDSQIQIKTESIVKINVQSSSQSRNQIDSQISKEKEKEYKNESQYIETQQNIDQMMKILHDIKPAAAIDITPINFDGPTNERQSAVLNAFKHSWNGYKKFAWGHDNLKPISAGSYDWFGLGLTIVDSLDTIYIMNLHEEFDEARNWVKDYLHFDINRDVNLFEVTIRVLGGLLSAYHLSSDKMFLQKSLELADRLLPSFDSPSGIPYSDVNLASKRAHTPKWSPDSSTSEVTTIQLEFRDLSRSSGISVFEEVIQRVNEKVHALDKTDGLVPIFINANTGMFRNFATISLGARGDSYYEYLLKQWIQTGRKSDDILIQDYKTAIDGVIRRLVRKTPKDHLTFIGELIHSTDFKPKMDHLTCYLPGTLILGHKFGMPESHLNLANELLETCYQTYIRQATGLAPEISYFSTQETDKSLDDIQVKSNDAHNLLRPEFIESLYYFYAITHNKTYQDMGWNVFQAFEKYTKVLNGYTSIGNVQNIFNTRPRDMMESFWLSETLKYLYLLFSDNFDEIDLEKYVFNTEAHILPIREAIK